MTDERDAKPSIAILSHAPDAKALEVARYIIDEPGPVHANGFDVYRLARAVIALTAECDRMAPVVAAALVLRDVALDSNQFCRDCAALDSAVDVYRSKP